MQEPEKKLKINIIQSLVTLTTILAIIGILFSSNSYAQAPNNEQTSQTETGTDNSGALKYGMIAASIAFGLGAIGAGIAISHVGAAAMGAVAEKPQVAGQALIFVALAEGLVVFGFITALMILGKV
jgi:V/A-type H+-transporting ATPase subunit K